MTKDKTIMFHPTNNQTVPTPDPFGTEEARPKTSHRMEESFNVATTRNGMKIYFTIKSSITIMQLKHRVYHFLTANNVPFESNHISTANLRTIIPVQNYDVALNMR